MTNKHNVLIVDDDSDVRWMVKRYLEKHGLAVEQADGGKRMRELVERQSFDLIILDITMPGEDGLSLTRYLRENYHTPVIMLTASAEVVDRVVGLEMGADDYMTKPFDPRELLARVKSVLRRSAGRHGPLALRGEGNRVGFGKCVLDLDAHVLHDAQGNEVPLTSMEYDLLKAFAEHPNRVLSRDQLLNLAHNRDWEPFDRSIDIRIARILRKIEPDPGRPQVIKTVRGAGYVFVPSSD